MLARANNLSYRNVILSEAAYGGLPRNYWPLDEVNGTTLSDLMLKARGSGNSAFAVNTPPLGGLGPVNGEASRSMSTDIAFGAYAISAGSNVAWANRGSGNALTVECWAKFNWTSGYRSLILNRSGLGGYNWMLYQHITDGSLQLHGWDQFKSSYIPSNGIWLHVAATVSTAGVSKLFINGAVQVTNSGYDYHGDSPSSIGIGSWDGVEIFGGSIAHAILYDYELAADRVQYHYLAGLNGIYGGTNGRQAA